MNKLELLIARIIIRSKIFQYPLNDAVSNVYCRGCFSFQHLPTLDKKVKVTGDPVMKTLVSQGAL